MNILTRIKNGGYKNTISYKLRYFIVLCLFLVTQNSCKETICEYDDPSFPPDCNKGMDVVFAIDYTGSMGGAINNIKTSVSSIVNTIISKSGGDYRLALTIFDEQYKTNTPAYGSQPGYTSLPASNKLIINSGPTTNQYLTVMESFASSNTATFGVQLAKLNTSGTMALGNGGSLAEPGDLLIEKIVNSSFAGTWRSGVTKLVIIITDAPAGGTDDMNNAADDTLLNSIASAANVTGVQFILISSQATGLSNYETKLINGNTGGLKLMSANFANIAPDISTMINSLCENNSK